MSNSSEEEIARNYICFGNADATVVIVDATCLERNLNLVYQILEITKNVIVCVNLLDEAAKKGIHVGLKKLSKILGVPVVGTIARKKKTLIELIDIISKVCSGKIECKPNPVIYDKEIESKILEVESVVQKLIPKKYLYLSKWVSEKIIDGDKSILHSITHFLKLDLDNSKLKKALENVNLNIESNYLFRDNIISNIVKVSEETAREVCTFNRNNYNERNRKIDRILTSKTFGFPIMIIFLGIIFWITISRRKLSI